MSIPELAALLTMEQGELVKLLAVCVASTVDVVTPRAAPRQPGEELAQAMSLDLAAWWKPTAEGYFRRLAGGRAGACRQGIGVRFARGLISAQHDY